MSISQQIFKKLTASETSTLLAKLHEVRGTVLFKFPDTGVFRLKAASKGWGQSILAARPAGISESKRDQVVTGNFILNGQMFFFNAKARLQKKQLHLALTGDLQKLARRKLERLPVPESVPLHFVTKHTGTQLLFIRGVLQDLSVKGCKIALITARPEIKVGNVLTGVIRYGARKPISVTGTIRHQKRATKGRYDQTFGLEFSKCDDLMRLQNWFFDLQRELFALKSKK